MSESTWQNGNLPEEFDVVEVTEASDKAEAEGIIDGGIVEDWKAQEYAEKAKTRPFLVKVVLSGWSLVIVASVAGSLLNHNFLLVIPPALISVPITILMRYYFNSG